MGARKLVCLSCAQINRVPEEKLGAGPKCGTCGAALMPGKPVAVDTATLAKAMRTDEVPLLVDFWAPWCGPCRSMAPEFDKAAAALKGEPRLVKLDTQAHPEGGARWNIRSIPTLVLAKGGRERAREAGARPAQALIELARRG